MGNESKPQDNHPTQQFAIVPEFILIRGSPMDVKVYGCLALYVDWNTGYCWPSRDTIAQRLNVSLSSVKRSLKRLEQIGAIAITHRPKSEGDHDTNLYQLPFVINRRVGSQMNPRGVTDEPWVGSRTNPKQEPRTRIGLTTEFLPAEACRHLPVDDEGYCTACGSEVA